MDHISFKEIAQYLSQEETGPMHDVAARLQKVLQPWVGGPPIVEGPGTPPSTVTQWDSDNHLPARGQGRRMHAQRKQLLLSVGDMVMSRIEGGNEPEVHRRWLEAAGELLAEWRFMVERYEGLYRAAADGQPLRAPTMKEAHALHLLARYAIARFPRSSTMRPPPGKEGTLADPLYCFRLLLGTDGTRYYPREKGATHSIRSKDVEARAVSVAIRWTRAAAQRSLFTPVLTLLRSLNGERQGERTRPGHGAGPPPMPLRTGIYIAGAATAPEDIAALVPLLEQVDIAPDVELAQEVDTAGWKMKEEHRVGRLSTERVGPHAILVRALKLARTADGMGLGAKAKEPEADRRLEARMRSLFLRWGLPEMGKHGETQGQLLRSRTMHPEDEMAMEERATERARSGRKARKKH
jgi:hypothetical protein